jgi:hypothetical protein
MGASENGSSHSRKMESYSLTRMMVEFDQNSERMAIVHLICVINPGYPKYEMSEPCLESASALRSIRPFQFHCPCDMQPHGEKSKADNAPVHPLDSIKS